MFRTNQPIYKKVQTGLLPLIIVLFFLAIFSSCKVQQGFVKVKDTNFVLNKKTYNFVGTNLWYGAYLGADAEYGNRKRLLRELDQLQKSGINNLRVVAASEESDFGLPLSPPFQYKNGAYNEKLLQGLDFLLAEMGNRNLHAVLIMNNYWDWSGGMSEYVSWATGEHVFDPSVNKNQTWDQFMNFSARFYKTEEAQKRYRNYINTLVNRKNVYTNKLYKNDLAIMAWELANEPRPSQEGDASQSVKDFSKWVDQTAAYIHSVDPNHLVTTGSEGSKGTLNKLEYAKQVHQSRYIDYITFHLWPKNWGWYKADKPETMAVTKENTKQYIAEHMEIAKQLDKPIVLEEIGFVRDGETFSPDSPVTARNEFFDFVLKLLHNSIKEGNSFAGLNFWGWGGEGRAQQKDYMWKRGDITYVADPYSEQQGLNSVYDSDKSTLDILSRYAKDLGNQSSKKEKGK
ncbi:MAG: hypothetical protein ABI151_00990 [Chitinophagaceae bacterium]